MVKNQLQFKVLWQGYKQTTWEPEQTLPPQLVSNYILSFEIEAPRRAQKILAHKTTKVKRRLFQVKWKGQSGLTWEPEESVHPRLVHAYLSESWLEDAADKSSRQNRRERSHSKKKQAGTPASSGNSCSGASYFSDYSEYSSDGSSSDEHVGRPSKRSRKRMRTGASAVPREKKRSNMAGRLAVGRRVEKHFPGFGTHGGTIKSFHEDLIVWAVQYDDGDQEEVDEKEVWGFILLALSARRLYGPFSAHT